MWLATKHGFYSVVQKADDEFHIRARVAIDLANLRLLVFKKHSVTLPEIETWPEADYRYRIIVSRADALASLFCLNDDIDYDNFKSTIAKTPGQRHKLEAYHQIWQTMAGLQHSSR